MKYVQTGHMKCPQAANLARGVKKELITLKMHKSTKVATQLENDKKGIEQKDIFYAKTGSKFHAIFFK